MAIDIPRERMLMGLVFRARTDMHKYYSSKNHFLMLRVSTLSYSKKLKVKTIKTYNTEWLRYFMNKIVFE